MLEMMTMHDQLCFKYFDPHFARQFGIASVEEKSKWDSLVAAAVEALRRDADARMYQIVGVEAPHPNPFVMRNW